MSTTSSIAKVSDGVIHSQSPHPQPAVGAMALMEKYSNLNRGIEEAREEAVNLTSQIEDMEAKMEQLETSKTRTQDEANRALRETERLQEDIASALQGYRQLESSLTKASMEQDQSERLHHVQRRVMNEWQNNFLQQSNQFRHSIKRLRLEASELGMEASGTVGRVFFELRAGIPTTTIGESNASSIGDGDLPEPGGVFGGQSGTQSFVGASGSAPSEREEVGKEGEGHDENRDPSVGDREDQSKARALQWHSEAVNMTRDKLASLNDLELEQAMENYQVAWKTNKSRKSTHESVEMQHNRTLTLCSARIARLDQLQTQLERIRNENASLETSLQELREETKVTKAMSETFRKRCQERKSTQADSNQRTVITQNPYTRQNQNRAPSTTPFSRSQQKHQLRPPPYARHSPALNHPANGLRPRRRNTPAVHSKEEESTERETTAGAAQPTASSCHSHSSSREAMPAWKTTSHQHPHMTGRRRVELRFRSALPEIQGGHNVVCPPPSHEEIHQNGKSAIGSGAGVSATVAAKDVDPIDLQKTCAFDHANDMYDDDDDDDDILSFGPAFNGHGRRK